MAEKTFEQTVREYNEQVQATAGEKSYSKNETIEARDTTSSIMKRHVLEIIEEMKTKLPDEGDVDPE